MLRFLKLLTQSLLLVLITLFSALAAMRLAIHGREVRVPDLRGMTTLRAQSTANASGLIVAVEDRFYSTNVAEGEVISQFPAAGSRVRRGWRIRVAESLGAQRATIPDLIGQTQLAATLNLHERGLELGGVSTVSSTARPGQIVAQSPPPKATEVAEPKVSVLIAEPPPKPLYVMPDFIGRDLAVAKQKIAKAGLLPPTVSLGPEAAPPGPEAMDASVQSPPVVPIPVSGRIVRQNPLPGARVSTDTQIRFQVSR